MRVNLTDEFNGLFANKLVLPRPIEELRAQYKTAKPFPYVVVDDMFAVDVLESLLTEMAQMGREKWSNIEQDSRERTMRMRSAAEMGDAGHQLLSIVHSAAYLYLLSEITGITQLLPDPYLQGAGYARMRKGDYFNVHADRNVAYETGLTRRLAMIIFLNKTWLPAYNGKLELWNDAATQCEASIEPLFNRTIIFEVAYPNFHGVPLPLACPPERMRQSFITYYHTVESPENANSKPRTSIFAPRFYGTNRLTWRSLAREVTPPVLVRALRKLTKADR